MKTYEVKGTYKKKGNLYNFSKKVSAETENMAKEKTLAEMGGKQNLKRTDITLETVKVC
jgi:ribosomal protein L20A (L18A)